MNEQNQWYVTIDGNAVGPVSTDLVVRGIKHKRIATNAYVCVVGASEWQLLADVAEFHMALCEGGLLETAMPRNGQHTDEPLQSSEPSREISAAGVASPTMANAQGDANVEPQESHPDVPEANGPAPTESAPRNGKHVELLQNARPMLASMDVDIDVTVDESSEPAIDWGRGFSAYFLVGSEVTLPAERVLLQSLKSATHETFLHEEAMWNLALCLAFGTEAVASSAASVFFDVVTSHGLYERIEWMCRTLLSKGFMPSGIPHASGYRGLSYLQKVCPAGLLPKLGAEAAS